MASNLLPSSGTYSTSRSTIWYLNKYIDINPQNAKKKKTALFFIPDANQKTSASASASTGPLDPAEAITPSETSRTGIAAAL